MKQIISDKQFILIIIANFLSSVGSGITTIAASWLLVNQTNGEIILGYTMIGTTIIMFIIAPYVGVLIDRFSRKKIYLFNQVLGFCVIGSATIPGVMTGTYDTWQLVIFIFSFSLYFALHYPTLLALTQEIFSKEYYRSISGVLEVESQTASAVAGGITGLLLGVISYDIIFLFDMSTFIFSFIFISFIKYEKQYKKVKSKKPVWNDIMVGLEFLKGKRKLVILLISTLVPFMCVTAFNYVDPVYVTDILEASGQIYGLSSMSYALGAIGAGIISVLLAKKFGYVFTTKVMMISYLLFLLALVSVYHVAIYLAANLLAGAGNSGTRVMRRTLMLELIPNHKIGRVNSFFISVELVVRIILLTSFILLIGHLNAIIPIIILIAMMVIALVGFWYSKSFVQDQNQLDYYSVK
ncbi:MFS transporter [Filobacillus milosensis]|uniref:MFS transporter n=1 Tax=Filobacillus milosensis TaxID=94137 RepID=UPI001891A6AD|nr:MFS transporter [Filobacillus milosensis]